jgi:hypothetical protein
MTLTVVSQPSLGGSISALPGPAANGKYVADASVTLTAHEFADYVFINWSGDIGGIADVSQSTVLVNMIADRTINANFVPTTTRYIVTTGPVAGGSITLQPAQSDYLVNQIVSVSATPSAGYAFDYWTGDLSGTSPTPTLLVKGNKSIAAVFNPTITAQASPSGGGTIEMSPPQPSGGYTVGTTVTLRPRNGTGYIFASWGGDSSGTAASVDVTVDAPKWVTATFNPTVSVSCYPYEGGTVEISPPQPLNGYATGAEITVKAHPNSGYTFKSWGGNASGVQDTANIIVDSSEIIAAVFSPIVTVEIEPPEGGTVELTPAQPPNGYSVGTEITVEAKANKGYKFKSWGGDLSGSHGTAIANLSGPMTIQANFVKGSGLAWWIWTLVGVAALLVAVVLLAWLVSTRRNLADSADGG